MRAARILIAEDESLIAEELQDRVERMGMRVVGVVDTGEEAIARAGQEKPDLVLMDIRLKGDLDGIGAAAAIRDHFQIPVVYLTAHSDEATLTRAKRTAPLGYLLKPFAESDLRVTIDMALHKHELEKRLIESERRLTTTLASIGDGVIATDASGRVTFMNPVAEALTRWTLSDALGQQLEQVFQIVNAHSSAATECPVARALRAGDVVTIGDRNILITRAGPEISIADSAAPNRDQAGTSHGGVLVFREIGAEQQAREALKKTEEELRQAHKMEAIGRLAGGIAHDFNNLMTVVIGYGEILLSQFAEDHPAHPMIKAIKDAGDRAATITRQLLAFGRKQTLLPIVLNLNEVLRNVEQVLRRVIREDIQIVCKLQPDLGHVRIDHGQLEQIILNLALNARDAMTESGVLTLETYGVSVEDGAGDRDSAVPPGRYVVLAVADTGCGMDAATQERVFEPFFTTKVVGQGTGLGLATVYGIVKQSDGHIVVTSRRGQGSTFKVYLPEIGAPEALAEAAATGSIAGGSETVLLVEDSDNMRGLTRWTLQQYGYNVLEAADAAEALKLFGDDPRPIDLLLTDAIMPHISGRHLAQLLRPSRPDLKVLYMSGHTGDQVLRHGALTAEMSFIQKPFAVEDLARRVREVLDQ